MKRYHFNPTTGNAGLCKAVVGNCPFLLEGARHFDTREQAQVGIEQFFTESYASLAGRLVVQRNRIQREIIDRRNAGDSYQTVSPLIEERNNLDSTISELEASPDEASPKYEVTPRKILYGGINQDRGDKIIGFSNRGDGLHGHSKESADATVAISEEWVSRLKTEEVKVIHEYSGNPAAAVNHREAFDKALRKAPPLHPTTVYSGLSLYVAQDVLRQVDSGSIELNYPISTSLNAAQVNSFMHHADGPLDMIKNGERNLIALEIETTVGAPLAAITSNPQEFEVLLPAGKYEVVEIRKDVTMLWSEDGAGRQASKLIKLKRVV